jgi:transcriptional regulator with XRE-family HTH domain
MDVVHVVRAVRRQAGLSQRGLAREVGCSARAVAAWECGERAPSATLLEAVLALADLDLALVPRVHEGADEALRRHLHLSLTQRLRLALGEPMGLSARLRTQTWADLSALSRRGQVVLEGAVAAAMWLPIGPVTTVQVSLFRAKGTPEAQSVEVRLREDQLAPSLIPVVMQGLARVWVLPPAELGRPTDEQAQLLLADRVLHAEAPVDDAYRRRPAHRDPDAMAEDWRLLQTKSVLVRPDMRDGRAWRLGAAASLAQQVVRG